MPFLIIAAVIILILIYCRIETLSFKVTGYNAVSHRIPGSMNGFKVLVLSDLHCISFGKKNSKLLKAIEEEQPGFVIISGDLVNGKSEREFGYAAYLLKSLRDMRIPVYYTFGNHELKYKLISEELYNRYVQLVEQYCTLINNDSYRYFASRNDKDSPVLFGLCQELDYYKGRISDKADSLDIGSYIGQCDSKAYNVLIAHDPGYYKQYLGWGADLIISGHLHGGIARLPFIGGLISPRYTFFPRPDKGQYIFEDGRTLIISGGLGWHALPFRFLNRPEILRINFVKGSNQ